MNNNYRLHKMTLILSSFINARKKIWLLHILVLAFSFSCLAQDETTEYDIKAAFIYKFTNYIDWGSQFQGNEFVIGVVGPSPVKDRLDEIARTQTVNNKKIVVRQFKKLEEITPCQMLFVSQDTPLHLKDILAKITGKGTLIISEKEGYAAQGAHINFIVVDNKLRFEANLKAINAAGLKASSQLLKLANIID